MRPFYSITRIYLTRLPRQFYCFITRSLNGDCLQTFYPLVARAELHEDAMPIEFMQDRKLDFIDYSKLKPFTVSTTN